MIFRPSDSSFGNFRFNGAGIPENAHRCLAAIHARPEGNKDKAARHRDIAVQLSQQRGRNRQHVSKFFGHGRAILSTTGGVSQTAEKLYSGKPFRQVEREQVDHGDSRLSRRLASYAAAAGGAAALDANASGSRPSSSDR